MTSNENSDSVDVKTNHKLEDFCEVEGSEIDITVADEFAAKLASAAFVAEKNQCYSNARMLNKILGVEYWEGVLSRNLEVIPHAWNMHEGAILDYSPQNGNILTGKAGEKGYFGVRIPDNIVQNKREQVGDLKGTESRQVETGGVLCLLRKEVLDAAIKRHLEKPEFKNIVEFLKTRPPKTP